MNDTKIFDFSLVSTQRMADSKTDETYRKYLNKISNAFAFILSRKQMQWLIGSQSCGSDDNTIISVCMIADQRSEYWWIALSASNASLGECDECQCLTISLRFSLIEKNPISFRLCLLFAIFDYISYHIFFSSHLLQNLLYVSSSLCKRVIPRIFMVSLFCWKVWTKRRWQTGNDI